MDNIAEEMAEKLIKLTLQEICLVEHWQNWRNKKDSAETFFLRISTMMKATRDREARKNGDTK
jgi:hypothetical protein